MGHWKDHPWHKLNFVDKVISIVGLLIFIPGAILFYSSNSIFSMCLSVIGGWMIAYVIIRAAIIAYKIKKNNSKS